MAAGRFLFASVTEIPAGFWRWPHVDAKTEWACHGDGSLVVVPEFLDRFELLREACGFALPINSGYRSPAYNRQVASSGDDGPHTTGLAVDLRVYGSQAHALLGHALRLGFRGIGSKQHGPVHSRYLHLDDVGGTLEHPRPWHWSYA